MKAIYKIKVNNWDKHNPKAKKGYKKIMINTRFFEDAKIQMLPPGARLVFIGLVLACGDVGESTVEASHEALLKFTGGRGQHIQMLLDQLQSFQLVTYEIMHIKRSKVKESKVKESKRNSQLVENSEKHKDKKQGALFEKENHIAGVKPPAKTAALWSAYSETFKNKYDDYPADNSKIRSQMSKFIDLVGNEEAIEIVKFYLTHENSYYARMTHDFGCCLKDAHTLRTQWLKGRQITQADIHRYEKNQETSSLLKSIERDGV